MPMDYSELVATKSTRNSIRGWINWDEAPAEDILAEAEAFIYSSLRVREMKRLATGTILAGVTYMALPDDFIAPRSFRRTGASAGRIDIRDDKMFEKTVNLDEDGDHVVDVPTACSIYDDPPFAYFNVETATTYPYRLVYWRRPEALSTDNPTNFLTTRYPMLLRSTCLGFANQFQKNSAAATEWLGMATGFINQANSDYDLGEQANRVENYWEHDDG